MSFQASASKKRQPAGVLFDSESLTVAALHYEKSVSYYNLDSEFDSLSVSFCQGLPNGRSPEILARTERRELLKN